MIHNRKRTMKILKIAKEFGWKIEAALILVGMPIKVIEENNYYKLLYNEKAKQNL